VPSSGEGEALVQGDRVGPGLTQRVVGYGVDEVAVQAERDALAYQASPDGELVLVEPDDAVLADDAVDFDGGALWQPDATGARAGQGCRRVLARRGERRA
jgi:hypothetical protein